MATVKRTGSTLERECSECKSRIVYTTSDVVFDDVGHVGDHLICPVCSKRDMLGKVPNDWKQHINARWSKEVGL